MCQFQQIVEQFFKDFGRLVAKWPLLFLVCSSALAFILTAGFVLSARSVLNGGDDDQFRLFLPENAESMKNLARLRSMFPISARDAYDVFQSSYAYLIITSTDTSANILKSDILRSISEIVDQIRRIRVKVGWMEASWNNLCVKDISGLCLEHPLINFLNFSIFTGNFGSDPISTVKSFLTYPTARFGGRLIDNSVIWGGVTVGDEGEMTRSAALRLPFVLQTGDSLERRTLNELWQREFVRVARRLRYRNLSVYVSSSISWRDEMDRNGAMLISYLPALFAVLLIFSVLCCCTSDWVTSQPWLGFFGLLSAVLAVTSAFGVLFFFRYQYMQVVVIMPFLVLSVSADNAFLMLNAWRCSGKRTNLENRMSATISQSAVSILITALTDGLSFTVGSASQFPAVRIFCTYCAVAILFAFVYQTTFFAAWLTFCGRRELADRHCLTLRTVETDSNRRKTKENSISIKFSAVLATLLDNNFVKFLVILLYALYLGFAIFGVTGSQLRLNMSNLVPYDSYVVAERRISDRYFSDYSGFAQAVVFTENAQFHEPQTTVRLIDLYEKLCATEYSSQGEFWLNDFMRSVPDYRSISTEQDFVDRLKHFLRESTNLGYTDDVVWTDDGRNIKAIRMFVRLRRVGGGNHSAAAHALKRRFSESKLLGFITDPIVFLLADQNDAVLGCVLQDAAVATGVIVVIVLVFLPKLLCALWIGLSILSINAGVVGFLALWGVQVDIVSMMTTVMSVGLSVDYVAHITYRYLITKHSGSYRRLRGALEHAGWSSVQSAAATVLGASTLAFVDSYMVRTFVKSVILVVALGLLHGLLFLPVALSAFVPADQYLESNNYGRVRAYVSATFRTRSPQRRLANYFVQRSNTRIKPDPGPQDIHRSRSDHRHPKNRIRKKSRRERKVETPSVGSDDSRKSESLASVAWTSTNSQHLILPAVPENPLAEDGSDYLNSGLSSGPVYDSPPYGGEEISLSPDRLVDPKLTQPGEVVEIVLKPRTGRPSSMESSQNTSDDGLLTTFQSSGSGF